MNNWSEWPSPAKLNLFLHIVGRRIDGYHLLQTMFQLLDWGDKIRFRVRNDGIITRLTPLPNVPETADLCIRAARLLQQHTNCSLGAEIALEKRIPMGGGLGGGSSNAATVLIALNELWNTKVTHAKLLTLGATLGADVPVFIHGKTAWAEGIGEQLTAITLPEQVFVILDPQVNISTVELFQTPELTRNAPRLTIRDFLAGVETTNAFETLVRNRYTAVDAALTWLNQFGLARLTGTGGCVFLAVESQEIADAIVNQCPPNFVGYTARGLAISPLNDIVK